MKNILFLDDIRNPNDVLSSSICSSPNVRIDVVRSYEAAVRAVMKDDIVYDEWWLDHDLGMTIDMAQEHHGDIIIEVVDDALALSGYDFITWAEEHAGNRWPLGEVHVHSANPVGAKRMMQVIAAFERRNS
jgi:hypothetical protein